MTGEEKIQMIANEVETTLGHFEAQLATKEQAVRHLTDAILEWVFQEAHSWATQVNSLNWATKDAFLNPDNELVSATYVEMKRSLNARIKITFELKEELERVKKKGGQG